MRNRIPPDEGLRGTATINSITDTGTQIDMSPVIEFDLTVTVADRAPYGVKHRQVISPAVMHNFRSGATMAVRVDARDPEKLIFG